MNKREKERIRSIRKRIENMVNRADSEGTAEVNAFSISNDMNWLLDKVEQQQQEIECLNDIIACFSFKDLTEYDLGIRLTHEGFSFSSKHDEQQAKIRAKEMGYYDWLFKEAK
jgi:hypothetical protein